MAYLIPHFIDRAADRAPDQQAICFGQDSLTYGQLAARSDSLANVLRQQGVRRGDRVAVYLKKSLEASVAMYGIMKTGAAYVPLDVTAPITRVTDILADCGIHDVVTQPAMSAQMLELAGSSVRLRSVIGLDQTEPIPAPQVSWDEVFRTTGDRVECTAIELDLAYIIYTSGSTGVPKGIMHTHRSAMSFLRWAVQAYSFHGHDRFANHAPLHFDMSTFDYFAAAASGATTVAIPEAHMKLPASYSQLLQDQRVSVLFVVPFALVQLLIRGALTKRDLSALRWIIFGGDTSSTKHIRDLMAEVPHVRFSHMYGPAETNGCTYYNLEAPPEDTDRPIPIGRMCENMEGLIRDDVRVVAPGEVGELYVRGPTVMHGYWNRPELNQRVFFRRELQGIEQVFYRTGDLVQMNAEGQLVFVGRQDRQVKIRGYRVELDEVEVALTAHEQVEEAAVFAVEDGHGSHELRAAVIPSDCRTVSEEQLASHLRSRLPAYAIPAQIQITLQLPRTSTGKIDRHALQQTPPIHP